MSIPDLKPGEIRTFTGRLINIKSLEPDDIDIIDIAHALSNQCRFGGHTSQFYSVAEHSVHVATGLPMQHVLAGLLHDASEAYLVDIPTPVKVLIPAYYELENKIMTVIANKFGFEYPLSPVVEKEDRWILEREWEQLIEKKDLTTQTPREAKYWFLKSFNLITNLITNKNNKK